MELQWKEPIDIPEGKQSGEITRVEYRETPFKYTDIYIKPDGLDIELKYGAPTTLSQNSKLGKLLEKFGDKYEKGKKSDPEKVLIGKQVTFMTINIEKEGKEYAEIVDGSIKPAVDTEKVSQ